MNQPASSTQLTYEGIPLERCRKGAEMIWVAQTPKGIMAFTHEAYVDALGARVVLLGQTGGLEGPEPVTTEITKLVCARLLMKAELYDALFERRLQG